MKRFVFLMIGLFLFLPNYVYAKTDKIVVTLSKCVDGDTAWFISNGEKIKTRFLAIDTPESTNKIEPYGKEASEYTCRMLTNATKIEIEYDLNSDKLDKYDRHLVWVFVDGNLLQEQIIDEGLAEVAYLYGDYKYTSILEKAETIAKKNKVGMWSETTEDDASYLYLILIVLGVIIIYICLPKQRKKMKLKVKSTLKKEIKKNILH